MHSVATPIADAQGSNDTVAIRHLRGATEYRGRRDALLSTGDVHAEWLPPERVPGQRMRATLRARDGGRDVFVRRLDDGRYCVLVIQTRDRARGTRNTRPSYASWARCCAGSASLASHFSYAFRRSGACTHG